MSEIFDDWFRRMRRFFDEMDRMIDELFREAMRGVEERRWGRPLVYGFSITYTPDGRPIIREFGNIKPGFRGAIVREEMEPFVDIIEEPDVVRVIAELPGVDKDDIDLQATEATLIISAERGRRKYYKEVKLPCKVKPETAKATYKNGVLEVVLEKMEKKPKEKGFRIKIE
ncbi:MAG: Hsp20/alpha crystallin family protein [Thermoprotei archaeon]|nr:MAG: Hsp20/alpha crystallin family protein [Thermoprotei archaeon]